MNQALVRTLFKTKVTGEKSVWPVWYIKTL